MPMSYKEFSETHYIPVESQDPWEFEERARELYEIYLKT